MCDCRELPPGTYRQPTPATGILTLIPHTFTTWTYHNSTPSISQNQFTYFFLFCSGLTPDFCGSFLCEFKKGCTAVGAARSIRSAKPQLVQAFLLASHLPLQRGHTIIYLFQLLRNFILYQQYGRVLSQASTYITHNCYLLAQCN